MTKKVKLAIFDEDLKCRKVGAFEVTDGNQIRVKSGGEGHFMPKMTLGGKLSFPYRSIFSPWKISWNDIYIVRKGASQCVDFLKKPTISFKVLDKDGNEVTKEVPNPDIDVPNPDPQLVKDIANKIMVDKLGDQPKPNPLKDFVVFVMLGLIIVILLATSGVIR